MSEYVYGTGRIDTGGRVFRNARFFTKPEPGATAVYLAGVFPAIQQAYERLGIPVRSIRPGQAVEAMPAIPTAVKQVVFADPGAAGKAMAEAAYPGADIVQRTGPTSGLTKREIEADLEGMSIEFDPRSRRSELLALRNEARAERDASEAGE